MRILKWVFATILFGLLFSFSIFKIDDIDTMQYLLNGKLILSQGVHVNYCLFNYVAHTCQVSYPHQWLSSLVMYLFYLLGSWNLLEILQIGIVVSVFFVVFFFAKRLHFSFFSTSIFIFFAILVGSERFMLRADLFGILLAVLFYCTARLYLEESQFAKSGWRKLIPIILLFFIQLVWNNAHGSFLLSFIILDAYLLAYIIHYFVNTFIRRKKVPFFSSHFISILILIFVTFIASMLNPFGLSALWGAFDFVFHYSSALSQTVHEWQSPFVPSNFNNFSIAIFTPLLVSAIIILALGYKKLRLADILIFITFAYLAISYRRNIALFALFVVMIIPPYLDSILGSLHHLLKKRPNLEKGIILSQILILCVLIVWSIMLSYNLVTNDFYIRDQRLRRFGFGLSENTFPIAASNFIDSNKIKGNMFNDYTIGTYLNWRFYPLQKTFIDGYTFSLDSLHDYNTILSGVSDFHIIAKKYDINYFILNTTSGDTTKLITTLYNDKTFKLVYFDESSVIFLANTLSNKRFIEKYGIDFASGQHFNPNLSHFKDPSNLPLGYINKGIVLRQLGFTKLANDQFQQAVDLNTHDYQAYSGLGITNAQLGNTGGALQAFQQAIQVDPNDASNHYNLGLFYFNTASYSDAQEEFKKALSMNSNFPNANFAIGLIYEKQGDLVNARDYFQRELNVQPNSQNAAKALENL